MFKKKLLTIVGSFLLLVGMVTAAWILSTSSNITGQVTSDGQSILEFEFNTLDGGVIDSSSGAVTETINNTIVNNNGLLTMVVDFQTLIVDVEDDCNNTGDITPTLFLDDVELTNGEIFNLTSGTHNVATVYEIKSHSCPQSFNTSIKFTEV